MKVVIEINCDTAPFQGHAQGVHHVGAGPDRAVVWILRRLAFHIKDTGRMDEVDLLDENGNVVGSCSVHDSSA